ELDDQRPGNVLSFFSPPPNGMDRGFLDANRYDVAFDSRSGYEVPARSTSAEFVADWLGGPRPVDGVWESTIKVDPNDPVRVTRSPDGRLQVSGTLVNASGTVLNNVLVTVTVSDRLQPPTVSPTEGVPPDITANLPPNLGRFFSRAEPVWAPGEAWNLAASQDGSTSLRSGGKGSLGAELDDRFEFQTNLGFDVLSPAERIRDLQRLSLFQMLPQPSILAAREGKGRNGRFQRRMARGMDLSRRLTEPNLVLLATAAETPNPIPVEIEGEDRPGTGLVLLQWIHPLPVDVERLVPQRAERFAPTPGPRDRTESDPNDGVAAAWR
ncbi:MAG: hypothetical protein VX672_07230, partial [Planctomycetota bacterium]|nr:hypothetical protein [Planctomycetota bacterium]